jgi:AcrR family transcriptional regulator
MPPTVTPSQSDTRARILAEAERLFRQLGYGKTTVAEIARCCGMSPANVYRFFASKAAINEAICADQLAEGEALARRIARRAAPADARLTAFVCEIHDLHKERFAKERKLHELVETAMAENWRAIETYKGNLRAVLVTVIADGVREGIYTVADPEQAGRVAFNTLAKVFNPALIAQCSHEDLTTQAAELAAFIDGALRSGVAGRADRTETPRASGTGTLSDPDD